MSRSATLCSSVLALGALCLLACGVGPVEETYFSYGAMGTEGGTVHAGDVTIEIPPGALTQATTVAILPETNPHRIDLPAGDPCAYVLLGPQWCCGPVGLDFAQPGRCVVTYDVLLIPPGYDEDDLVLLLWDDQVGALVLSESAVQDQTADSFTVSDYQALGHLAVGVGTCPDLGVLIAAFGPPSLTAGSAPGGSVGVIEGDPYETGMYLVTIDGAAPPEQVATGGYFPSAFLASPDGELVLFVRFGSDGDESLRPLLHTVTFDGADPVLIAGDDEDLVGFVPVTGWLRNVSTVFLHERVAGDEVQTTRLSTVPGRGGADPVPLYGLGSIGDIVDLRQSPDGALLLVRYVGDQEAEVIDVIQSLTGTPVSQGAIPLGGGQATPRFLPTREGVYLVADGAASVDEYGTDGTNRGTLFTLPTEQGLLKDFVLGPDGDAYAYIAGTPQSSDVLYVGSLLDGPRSNSTLGYDASYEEFLFHPNGEHVLLDSLRGNVRIFSALDASQGPSLVAQEMRLLDIHETTGQILMTEPPAGPFLEDEGELSETISQIGVYVADPDGHSAVRIELPQDLDAEQARWIQTIRRAPGMPFDNRIR